MSILHRIKQGKKNVKIVNFPGTEEKVAITILSSEQTTQCKLKAEKQIESSGLKDETYRDIILQQYLAFEFLRDKDDVSKKLIDDFEEFKRLVDGIELAYLVTQYNLFVQENSPFLNAVNEEQLELLKKTLEKMNLKDLSGESLIALRNFLMSLV